MKIFIAGASGAIGKQLVPRLVAGGHDVVGMTRSESKQGALRDLGATPVVADALDSDQVGVAVAEAEPDVIIHELTAIATLDLRHFDRSFAATNRLRTEGTDNLLAAGRAVGVKRFIAQSYASWPYARTGGPVKTEDDPLDPTPAREMVESMRAIRASRGRRARRRLDRGDRPALRRPLRSRNLARARWRAVRDAPQAQVPGGR